MLQELFSGATIGILYGMIGIGFVIIHRISGMINFSMGELVMVGGFAAVISEALLPGAAFLAPIAGLIAGGIAGLVLYLLVIRPLREKGLLVQTIATLAAAIVFQAIAQLAFGTTTYSVEPLTAGSFQIGGATLSYQALWLGGVALLVFVLLKLFFERTMIGRALTACAINRYAAGVVGINVALMGAIAFTLSGAVVGLIGAVAAPLTFVTAATGLSLALKGFIAGILGGFDKLGLALVGGILVGIVESLAASFISTSYQDVIVLALLLVLLIVRPSGLTRNAVSARV